MEVPMIALMTYLRQSRISCESRTSQNRAWMLSATKGEVLWGQSVTLNQRMFVENGKNRCLLLTYKYNEFAKYGFNVLSDILATFCGLSLACDENIDIPRNNYFASSFKTCRHVACLDCCLIKHHTLCLVHDEWIKRHRYSSSRSQLLFVFQGNRLAFELR